MTTPIRLALVGDRSTAVRAHERIPGILAALADRLHRRIEPYWLATEGIDEASGHPASGFDGIWLVPGSPYRSAAGAMAAAKVARERGIPLLGTCGGYQHAVWEFVRDVCGRPGAAHAEYDPEAADPVLVALECSLVGHEREVVPVPGTLAERILGGAATVQRYHCSYGLAAGVAALLEAHGMRIGAHDRDGDPRMIELFGHPFFVGTLFQPELAPDGDQPHPVIAAFLNSVIAHTSGAQGVPATATTGIGS